MMVNNNANIFYTKRFNQEGWFDTISYEFVVIPLSEVCTISDIQVKKKIIDVTLSDRKFVSSINELLHYTTITYQHCFFFILL